MRTCSIASLGGFLRDGVDDYWRQWWAFDTYGRPAQWWHAGGADFTPL